MNNTNPYKSVWDRSTGAELREEIRAGMLAPHEFCAGGPRSDEATDERRRVIDSLRAERARK